MENVNSFLLANELGKQQTITGIHSVCSGAGLLRRDSRQQLDGRLYRCVLCHSPIKALNSIEVRRRIRQIVWPKSQRGGFDDVMKMK